MKKLIPLIAFAFLVPSIWAVDVTITAIYGSGNPNTGWTANTIGDTQLALRAKNTTTGATPSNGSGTYTFASGTPWNFEFSINSNADGAGVNNLTAFNYSWSVDTDPTVGQAFVTFSPTAYADNSYGNNGTANGAGVEGTFAALGATNNVMQNSQNIGFAPFLGNPNIPGIYDILLSASLPQSGPFNQVSITVLVTGVAVPDGGSSAALFTLAIGAMALLRFPLHRKDAMTS